MPYTCPHCLWTSNNPNDKINKYCGHCHVFNEDEFEPTSFQRVLIRGLLHPQDPYQGMRAAVASHREQLTGGEMILHVMPLWGAQRLTKDQYAALTRITREIASSTWCPE